MDASLIFVIIVGALFVIGGPILGALASKATAKEKKEETNSK